MVTIQGKELPDKVPLTLITVRQPGFFLPGFKDIAAKRIDRSERNAKHEDQGNLAGTGYKREVTEQGKKLSHAGVFIELNANMEGRELYKIIEQLQMEGKAISIQDPGKKPDKKIELRSTLHPERRTRANGWLTKEDLSNLRLSLHSNAIRAARIWINPSTNEDGEVYYVANLMIGQYNPKNFPEHLKMINVSKNDLLTADCQLDLQAILAWKSKVAV